jgi:quercetin dioxygenase-like cupin family protein
MNVVKVEETKPFQNPHMVDARKIYTQNTEAIHMSLSKGQSLKKHTTPVNVFFYILEGKGVVEIGEETQEVEKDTIIDSPKGIPHLLRNTGESTFRFLVIKLPSTANK